VTYPLLHELRVHRAAGSHQYIAILAQFVSIFSLKNGQLVEASDHSEPISVNQKTPNGTYGAQTVKSIVCGCGVYII